MLFPICNKNVGADASARPPTLHRTPCKTPCHCETSDRCHWLWQSASPIPQVPLPKGAGTAKPCLGDSSSALLVTLRRGGVLPRPPGFYRIFYNVSLRTSDRCHWCGNPFSSAFAQGYYGCPCCGAQNFCAVLRLSLKILTAATRSLRFLCHRQRSVRSPRPVCGLVSE